MCKLRAPVMPHKACSFLLPGASETPQYISRSDDGRHLPRLLCLPMPVYIHTVNMVVRQRMQQLQERAGRLARYEADRVRVIGFEPFADWRPGR